ncbi:MAG: adenylate/guanylate cyclase domain-containing protein [Verrucomicrobia bacterium]|nr:adenylate/guanylate cyclase domain-containing protein [Verrucomicrobiota bacterium]
MSEGRFRRRSGLIAVVGVPLLIAAIVMGGWTYLQPIEAMTVDLRMRWRLRWTPDSSRADTRDLVLLAIDQKTEDALGRYGAGRWLSREPFLDHLRFVRAYCRPSVLAYDVIFKDTQGSRSRNAARISETPARTGPLADALSELASEAVDCVSDTVLSDLSQLVVEQGNIALAHGFASVWEDSRFASVLGFNLRGGWVDPQAIEIPSWSAGGKAMESGVAYLSDIAIPESCIHFRSEVERDRYEASPNANLPTSDLWDYTYLGSLNIPRDVDGVVRSVPLVVGFSCEPSPQSPASRVFVPSFSLLSVLLHLGIDSFPMDADTIDVHFGREIVVRSRGESYHIPIDALGRMRLNYRWRLQDFAAVSFVRLAPDQAKVTEAGRVALAKRWCGLLRDRIAVVGVTVTGVDVGPTPIDANTPLVYAQLTAINDILTRSFLQPVTFGMGLGVMIGVWVMFALICLAIRGARVVLAAFLLLLAYGALAYGGLHFGAIALPIVAPVIFIVTSVFWVLSFRYLTESRARRRIRGMFSTMVSGRVLSFLEDHPESFSLEGHAAHATVLFSDIVEFTNLSERLSPEKLIQLLNAYLTPVTDSVLEWGGYLDKYVGDSVMAVWGAPYADRDHALKACLSALEQQRKVRALNEAIETDYGFRLRVRMGINSGEVTAGNMGSERKFQYTVLGDPVNLASRLEPANREFGTDILIGEATERLVSEQLETREVCRIMVSGREQVVTAYELLGKRGELDEGVLDLRRQYDEARQAFYDAEWSCCIATLEAILQTYEDGPAAFLLGLARQYQKTPPPGIWKGAYVRTEKG